MSELEKRDLYDKDRNLTGKTIYKGEPTPDGYYIIVVLVFIQNSKGEFLIQKRSKMKDGKYASTGGHAKSGEDGVQAIITEVKEEIGVTLTPDDLDLIYTGREDKEHVFFDIFFAKKDLDISNLKLQEEEVESVKWASLPEIYKMIEDGDFLINHAEEVYRMVDIFKKRGIDLG